MRSPAGLAWIALVGANLLPATSGSAAEPVRIVAIGDSITQGGRTGRDEFTYRLPLTLLLKEAEVSFDFVGSRQAGLDGSFAWPAVGGEPFDLDHEGYYGAKTTQVRENLAKAMPKWNGTPDVALIHLGTNDQDSKDPQMAVAAELAEIIRLLRERNPRMTVLVGHLNFNGGAAEKIRPLVEEMAARLSTKESAVVTVHHYEGWVENPGTPGSDTFDWAHPNPQGQRKMAEKWFTAMQPYLRR